MRAVPRATPPSEEARSATVSICLLDQFREFVEELMQHDEVVAAHVPVGVLRLRVEVAEVGELLVDQFDQRPAVRGGDVDPGVEGLGGGFLVVAGIVIPFF